MYLFRSLRNGRIVHIFSPSPLKSVMAAIEYDFRIHGSADIIDARLETYS